ncbi:acetylcholine receptor subunit beta-like 2 [Leptotrombidium deliense]|uniref:Acetylcholine receptor subunit beta-like 2 n=1 Tax=Leptotrombidium deliense TaxID=299467 RepID=A0A443S2H6_9ACAR|nr:acetylcholine receptor subunit beta-like 2 [Leptotrombidium deliense]
MLDEKFVLIALNVNKKITSIDSHFAKAEKGIFFIANKITASEWWDNKLQWDPGEYGGVETLYVPAEEIWLPDIVLYNK